MKIKSNSTNKEPLTKMHNVELSEVVRKPSTRKTWRVNPSKLVRNAVVAGAAAAVLILSTNGNFKEYGEVLALMKNLKR